MKRLALTILLVMAFLMASALRAEANFHNTFVNIFEKVKDSVVSIAVRGNTPRPDGKLPILGGAGFIWTSDGYIISAAHLFQGNIKEIDILIGRNIFKARLVGRDNKTDIALLKIDGAPPLKPLPFGNSDEIKIGEWIASIGDPFGLDGTMTHGTISGKQRNINGIQDEFIQHDSAVNPGNSGGPLVNLKSEVIGMNTIIAEGNNTSFAVPINLIKIIAPMLKTSGKVTRSWLGVDAVDAKNASDKMIDYLNLPPSIILDKNAVIITEVFALSPADNAGVRKGDIVKFFNGKKIKNSLELMRLISYLPSNKIVYLVIERQNKLMTLSVKTVFYE